MATLLIAGETAGPRLLGAELIELQLRRARFAGAAHAVIYVERVTAGLLAIVDRLRGEGLSVDVARSVADAAELIHPDERILLIASDVILSPDRLSAVANTAEPVLLCVRDEPANHRFELIDPTARWTGFARIDGGLLRRTAAMVGDWDLGSTLMRRAAQEGTARITLTPHEAGTALIILDTPEAAQIAARRLISLSRLHNAGWGTYWLIAPLGRLMTRIAADVGVQARWVTLTGFGLSALSTATALGGWIVASLILLLCALACDAAASIATKVGAGSLQWEASRRPVRASAAVVVGLAMGITLTLRTVQWGCAVLALVVIAATWFAAPLARDNAQMARWRSDASGHALIGLAGFALGLPVVALAISAAHAVLSLGAAMRTALARP